MSLKVGEQANAHDGASATVSKLTSLAEAMRAAGHFEFKCVGPREEDRDRYCVLRDHIAAIEARDLIARTAARWLWLGRLRSTFVHLFGLDSTLDRLRAEFLAIPLEEKWADAVENLVVTVGKNLALDTILAGSSYTVVGPYLGLTGATPSPASGDTMVSHAGWTEVGGGNAPTYTSPRKTITFSSAASGSKASTGTYTYAITSSGTVGGGFLVFGSGAVSTIDSTAGTLLSCGAFTQGNKTVGNGDAITATYTLSM
jgi:hypothetical protein